MQVMKQNKMKIRTVLATLSGNCDITQVTACENLLVCRFAAVTFAAATVATFLLRVFIFRQDILAVLTDSVAFLVAATFFYLMESWRGDPTWAKHLISIVYAGIFLHILFRFYPLIGSAIWTIGFILAVLAMLRSSRSMLYYMLGALAIGCVAALIFFPNYPAAWDAGYLLSQTLLFFVLFAAAFYVQSRTSLRHQTMIDLLIEMNKQNEERKKVEEETTRLAMYDHLTGLPNRTLFYDRLKQAILLAKRNKQELYVLFVDVDFFKYVNDTLGHAAGDEFLRQAGVRLESLFRASDTVSRFGGDEFLILLQNIHEPMDHIAQNMLNEMQKPFLLNRRKVSITCSMGIARYPKDGDDAASLVKHADMAMYKAKSEGKNNFAYFCETLRLEAMMEMELVKNLHIAMRKNNLELYYQPIVECTTAAIVGVEALIRWNHPKLGVIQPKELISLAEKTGLIVPLGNWVIRSACKQNKKWQAEGLLTVPVAVNLSLKQLEYSQFAEQVAGMLSESRLDPKYLIFDISEKSLINNLDRIRPQLSALKEMNISLCIDDFGRGYSLFRSMDELPIERIKISMESLNVIGKNMQDESVITVINAFAQHFKLGVVAECVESKGQLEYLEKICTNMQGNYFSQPMDAAQFKSFLENRETLLSQPEAESPLYVTSARNI